MAEKIEASMKGVKALRDTQDEMCKIVNQMKNDSHEMRELFFKFQDELGVHSDDYFKMIQMIEQAVEEANLPIINLARKLGEVADAVEAYVKSNPGI